MEPERRWGSGRLVALLLVVVAMGIACASGGGGDVVAEAPAGAGATAGDPGVEEQQEEVPETPEASSPDVREDAVGGEEDSGPGAEDDVDARLADVEGRVRPLGDVLGVSRPAGSEPVSSRVTSYPRLCPADDLAVVGLVQEDPLVENLPVQRYIVVFGSVDAAAAFFGELASTQPGCTGERSSEVSVATATIDRVDALDLPDGQDGFEVVASIEVDMIDFDRDPPGAEVRRSVAMEGAIVVVVVSLAAYESLIGVEDIHGALLADGLDLAASIAE